MSPEKQFEVDRFITTAGPLEITFIGHGSLMLNLEGLIMHIDPYSELADYSQLPKADIILVTHDHGDHLDLRAINQVMTTSTQVIYTAACKPKLHGGQVMKNGESRTVKGIPIEAVPAYNLKHVRASGEPFHPQGEGNGYVLTIGDQRIYIAGDTEDIPSMEILGQIEIAFLPMNLPYTMTPEMTANAVRMIKPRILYPYHYGKTDPAKLIDLLKKDKKIEVRIRQMQ